MVINRPEQTVGNRRWLFVRIAGLFLLLGLMGPAAYGHPDLQLQIETLTKQLENEPGNVDLLLKRGDLQRRHQSPDLARSDFKQVREIQPENSTVDWLEGRLEVEAGQPDTGVQYLNRFLLINPGHAGALQSRARGYMLLDQPLLAAQDFDALIQASDNPGPSLFSAHARALVAAGADYYSAAMDVVTKGLMQFPTEISLTGIGTDIALVQTDTSTADKLINQLPASTRKLPQWQIRKALLDCQAGHDAQPAQWFSNAAEFSAKTRHTLLQLSKDRLLQLAAAPEPTNCQAAALEILQSH